MYLVILFFFLFPPQSCLTLPFHLSHRGRSAPLSDVSLNMTRAVLWLWCLFALGIFSWPYDPSQLDYNLNTNKDAEGPLEYSGKWGGHKYTASPKNWRFPFYTL